jgi:RNA-directed DNA polymerase
LKRKQSVYFNPGTAIVSPILANLTLDGLEKHLKKVFKPKWVLCKTGKSHTRKTTGINVVRYADDFIVTGRSKRQLEQVKLAINAFLTARGLKINEKTSIRHLSEGFDFLGWSFFKYDTGTLLCKISKKSISKHRKEIKYLTKTTHEPEILIPKLNAKIRGWMNYHHCCNGICKVSGSMNKYLYQRLMKWGCRRHSNKTNKWIFNNYWKNINGRMTFHTNKQDQLMTVMRYNLTQKKIRTRLSYKVNVFDLKNKDLIRKKQLSQPIHLPYKKEKL